MADVSSTVNSVVGGVVSLVKGLVVLFVFANIIYPTGFDPVGGIIDLVGVPRWRLCRSVGTVTSCFIPIIIRIVR